MSPWARADVGLEDLYRVQDCETGNTWNPVMQSLPLTQVGPHLINTCIAYRDGIAWYFNWHEKILWLISVG